MNEIKNPIAELDEPDTGIFVSPEEAYKIKDKHKFFCPSFDCKDTERILIVKKSKHDTFFFCHKPGFDHDISPETLLHKMAIRWFVDKGEYEIPLCHLDTFKIASQIIKIDSSKTTCEFRDFKKIIPDVILTTNDNFVFAIEIVVTSDLNENKIKDIASFNLPTIRVDLSDFYNKNKELCRENNVFIGTQLDSLLTNLKLKKWVVAPKEESINDKLKLEKIFSIVEVILTILIIIGLGILADRFKRWLDNL